MNQEDADQLRQWVSLIDTRALWKLIVWLFSEWAYRQETELQRRLYRS